MNSPHNMEEFLKQVDLIRILRGKATNLLFNDIENDINEKSSFLLKQ